MTRLKVLNNIEALGTWYHEGEPGSHYESYMLSNQLCVVLEYGDLLGLSPERLRLAERLLDGVENKSPFAIKQGQEFVEQILGKAVKL